MNLVLLAALALLKPTHAPPPVHHEQQDDGAPVGIIVFVVFVTVFIWIVVAAARRKAAGIGGIGGAASFDRLANSGIRARALVLASSNVATGMTVGGRRFEQRVMTLEIEIPGRDPYVIAQGTFMVPRGLVEPVPGSSLDVAVHPRDPNNVSVIGPGGLSGPWLNFGPPNPY